MQIHVRKFKVILNNIEDKRKNFNQRLHNILTKFALNLYLICYLHEKVKSGIKYGVFFNAFVLILLT